MMGSMYGMYGVLRYSLLFDLYSSTVGTNYEQGNYVQGAFVAVATIIDDVIGPIFFQSIDKCTKHKYCCFGYVRYF